jgi:predicted acyl esterase
MRDHDYVFLKGHRIMVQVQSTWFPIIDRNPQKFVSSIYKAQASDFTPAIQRVYSNPEFPSHLVLPVMP